MIGDVLPNEEGLLPLNERKQQFSFGYVRMVVASAGCSVKSHATDYDGVDITIVSAVAWTMKEKPFAKLTNGKRYTPAYLGVLVVPAEPEAWLDQDEDRLVTRSRLYWAKASDLVPFSEDGQSRTVYLPRSNLFDVGQLLGIMKSIGEGGDR